METQNKYYIKQDKKAFFFPQDFIKVFNLASNRQKFTISCLMNTGARINEIRNIEPNDIDYKRKNINLRITKVRAKLKETRPSPRIIPMSTNFYKYLKKNIKKHKILSTNATRIMIHKLAKECKIKNWKDLSAHNFRKTFGTWLLALNVDGFKLAQHLGHSPEILRTHYASPDIFNIEDRMLMREILDDLPIRLGAK